MYRDDLFCRKGFFLFFRIVRVLWEVVFILAGWLGRNWRSSCSVREFIVFEVIVWEGGGGEVRVVEDDLKMCI